MSAFRRRPPAHNYDIKIILFSFIIRIIIILCGVIIGEMFRSDKRWSDTQASPTPSTRVRY